jgi:DNA repair exonuclease SbcCD ATPase subunit
MIEIQNISWRNFMSYGDEVSSLDLANLGQVLITGEIEDDTQDGIKKSNGSGKSTIPNVILWVLFGRTMHSASPGDSVINYYTGKECWAKITFKNGDSITRTRGTKSHNELIYMKNGEEQSLSTGKNLQQLLNKDLSLDWELFTNSAFFTQYGKSWLEMADNSRKKALERILRVDRFANYASAAKQSAEKAENKLSKYNTIIETKQKAISNLRNTIAKNELLKSNFENNKRIRLESIKLSIQKSETAIAELKEPDIEKLTQTWDVFNKIAQRIESLKNNNNDCLRNIKIKESAISERHSKIENWQKKKGQQCLTCQQLVDVEHVQQHIEPIIAEKEQLEAELNDLKSKFKTASDSISEAESKLITKKPKITIREAKSIINEINTLKESIERDQKWYDNVDNETNPYLENLDSTNDNITTEEELIQKANEDRGEHEFLYKHYTFIQKAYSDRNRIKSYVFREHIPFINQRLNHYLEMMNLHIRINLTENLGLDSNLWGYDFQSGGERKRTDVAFMLAAFDFHEMMYGRQSNILVLDEVDGRMDDDGIDGLINIIKQELASKAETILIVSHRNQMHDVFDKEIKVIKSDNTSRIKQM